jgi:23S rRNA (guanosine2251-2'-O)-methyltransferase
MHDTATTAAAGQGIGFAAGGIMPFRPDRKYKQTNLENKIRTLSERDLDKILDGLNKPPFLLILDGVLDPHNLGACFRSASGAGVHAIIAPKDRSAPMTETVQKISCGGAEDVPFVQVTNLARTMRELKDRGIWIVGTAHGAEKYIYDLDLKGPLALVMGSEEKGMRRLTRESCDFLGKIPMLGRVENLNVSVATGVCLYEAVRQRRQ